MKVIYGIGKTKFPFPNPVLTIGVFDGLHKGHQKLIRQMVRRAEKLKGTSIVMTFHPHPIKVLHPQKYLPYIISLDYRLKLINQLNVNVCYVVKFTKKLSDLTPEKFVEKYIVQEINPKEIYIGPDFSFGKDHKGSGEALKALSKEYGFKVKPVKAFLLKESVPCHETFQKIGSTLIRYLISEGRLKEAAKYLGRRVSIMGKVMHGDARGRKLGFPTLNIYPADEVIPPMGVYAVWVMIKDKKYKGMANIGYNPTFMPFNKQINIEVHVIDWNMEIYGEDVIIEFIKKIREEVIFPNHKALMVQLHKDKKNTEKILKS